MRCELERDKRDGRQGTSEYLAHIQQREVNDSHQEEKSPPKGQQGKEDGSEFLRCEEEGNLSREGKRYPSIEERCQEGSGSNEVPGTPKRQKKLTEYVNIRTAMKATMKNLNLVDLLRGIPSMNMANDEHGKSAPTQSPPAVGGEGKASPIGNQN